MIKSASLNDELFIVLTFNNQDLAPALKLQQIIAENYNLYPNGIYPQLHITLNRIKKNSITQANKIIQEQLKESNNIQISISNLKCLQLNNGFLTLQVDKTPSLVKLANKLHLKLSQNGISTIENYEEWKFHITIISNYFTKNPIPQEKFNQLCLLLDGIPQEISTYAETIEVWRPTLNPDKKCITSFNL